MADASRPLHRGFLAPPMIRIAALFVALGPAVGWAIFIPLYLVLNPTIAPDAMTLLILIAALFRHAVGLFAAYVVGIGPAAATAFLYALWDAAAPARWPRALVAAVIGALIAYGLALCLAPYIASVEADPGSRPADWIDPALLDRIEVRLVRAFVACGAIAGLVCAMAASLIGLTMRPAPAAPTPGRTSDMADAPRRLVSAEKRPEDDAALRPQVLADFTGQEAARKNLKIFIESAKSRGEALDHVLFVGPPGLGKTTLAQIVARELGVNFRSTSGPVIAKAGDLAAQLTNLEPRDVLFIDEIHRLNPAVEEILYPAMEDFQLDLIIGAGPAARSVKIDLARFTAHRRDDPRGAPDARRCATVSAFRSGSISIRPRNCSASSRAAPG